MASCRLLHPFFDYLPAGRAGPITAGLYQAAAGWADHIVPRTVVADMSVPAARPDQEPRVVRVVVSATAAAADVAAPAVSAYLD